MRTQIICGMRPWIYVTVRHYAVTWWFRLTLRHAVSVHRVLPIYRHTNWFITLLLRISLSLSLSLSFAEMPWWYVPVSRVLRLRTEFSIEQSLHVPIVPRLYGSIKFPRDPMWLRKSGIWHSSVRPAVNGCYVINVRRSLVITRSLIVRIHAIFDPTPQWNIGRILSVSRIIEPITCAYF